QFRVTLFAAERLTPSAGRITPRQIGQMLATTAIPVRAIQRVPACNHVGGPVWPLADVGMVIILASSGLPTLKLLQLSEVDPSSADTACQVRVYTPSGNVDGRFNVTEL